MLNFFSFKAPILLGFGVVLVMLATISIFSYANNINNKTAITDIDTLTLPNT